MTVVASTAKIVPLPMDIFKDFSPPTDDIEVVPLQPEIKVVPTPPDHSKVGSLPPENNAATFTLTKEMKSVSSLAVSPPTIHTGADASLGHIADDTRLSNCKTAEVRGSPNRVITVPQSPGTPGILCYFY